MIILFLGTVPDKASAESQGAGYGIETDDITFTTSEKSIVTINMITGKAKAISAGIDYVVAKAGDVRVKIRVVVK